MDSLPAVLRVFPAPPGAPAVVSLGTAGHGGARPAGWHIAPVRAIQMALLLLVVGNVGRIPVLDLGDRAAPLLVNDLAVLFALAVGGLAMLQARSLRLSDAAIAGLVFASIGALSALWGVQRFGFSALEVAGSLAYLARWSVYFAFYILIINCVRARDTEAVWTALERAMLVIAAFGIVQSIFLPNFAYVVDPGARAVDWDAQRHRLVSTILEPNIVSGMLLMTLLVQLARMTAGARVPMWKPVLMFAALVMTLSRGGMLAFLVGCAVLLAYSGVSRRVVRLGGVLMLALLVAGPRLVEFASDYARFGVTDSSALQRVVVWQRALALVVEYPVFGIGFNTYGFVQERRGFERLGGAAYSAEGGLLFIAVLTGLVGLLVYLTMLWLVWRRCRAGWRDARATPAERGLLAGAGATTVAILVHSMFVNSLVTPWVMQPMLVLWGLAFVIASDLRRREAPA